MQTYVVACLLDISLVIDHSGSIRAKSPLGIDNWQLMLDFLASFVLEFNVGQHQTHVGAVSFGTVHLFCLVITSLQ